MLSNYLAELWGISLVLIALALLINQKYLKRLFVEVENDATLLFLGIASLVIGVAMVLSHNIWVKNWQTVITVLGWVTLLKGLCTLFLPDHTKKCVKKMENSEWISVALVVLVFIGLAITYFGFTA
jgi:uncharacterized protein YjeT (DUF2065 family)